jgi:hypothetical protein
MRADANQDGKVTLGKVGNVLLDKEKQISVIRGMA